jgi:hypothetical protein
MHQRPVPHVVCLLLATLLAGSLLSCATTPARPVVVLPNGYYLQPNNQEQSEITKRGGRVVLPGPVAAYAVSGHIVAGAIGKAPVASRLYADLAFTGGPNTQYFILDTMSGKLDSSLDKAQWSERLKQLAVPSDFQIFPPLPWQQ